jgi:hypothetical protein
MTDYSYYLISLTAMIKQYRNLVMKSKFDAAAEVAIDMQILTSHLQEWTEKQCTETPNS